MSPDAQRAEPQDWLIELAGKRPRGRFHRNIFVEASVRPREHVFVQELLRAGGDAYRSIAQYPAAARSPVNRCPMGVIDLDDEANPDRAQAEALACIHEISSRLGIPEEHLWATFSGHKGFHLFLAPQIFGDAANTATHWDWRRLANSLKETIAPSIDLAIYRDAGLIRIPNTCNTKTGLYDIPLSFEEMAKSSIDEIRELAARPRETNPWAIPQVSQQAQRWLEESSCQEHAATKIRADSYAPKPIPLVRGWHTPPCVRQVEQEVIPDGRRHQAFESLARFYASIGMAGDEICQRIEEINNRNPIRDPDFIPRMVGYVIQNPKFRSCPSVGLAPYCSPEQCPLHQLGQGKRETTSA